jgi:uncharacterized protein (DUF2164 family)
VHKREKDLVVATQGRSFWILDDLPVLHQMKDSIAQAAAHLFKPEDAYRMPVGGGFSFPGGTIGQNPPAGAVIFYFLKSKPGSDVTIEVLDVAGKSVKKFSSRASDPTAGAPTGDEGGVAGAGTIRLPVEAGLNRFVWDLRYPDATRFPGLILWAGETRGPRAVPGTYQVRLTLDGKTLTENFEVKKDPRIETTPADLVKQFELLTRIRDKLSETHEAIIQIRDIRRQVDEVARRIKDQPNTQPVVDAAKALSGKLTTIEQELYQTKNQSNQDPLNYPIKLNNKLAALASVVAGADAAPTDQSYAVYSELVGRIDVELQKFKQILVTDVPAFNRVVREQNVPAVFVR